MQFSYSEHLDFSLLNSNSLFYLQENAEFNFLPSYFFEDHNLLVDDLKEEKILESKINIDQQDMNGLSLKFLSDLKNEHINIGDKEERMPAREEII